MNKVKDYYQIKAPIIHGQFCKETKNRFLATVRIDGRETECYVPSSARLENFVALKNCRVLLIPTQNLAARTPYSILAVKHNRHNILLNTTMANKAMTKYYQFHKEHKCETDRNIMAEKTIEGYKADIYVESPSSKKIIEIKSVLSFHSIGIFPTVHSERANKQLLALKNLLDSYIVEYCIVAINPYIKAIHINSEQEEYHALFMQCIEKGMVCQGYSCALIGNKVRIVDKVPIYF